VSLQHLRQDKCTKDWRGEVYVMGQLFFRGLGDKTSPVSCLDASTSAEMMERISELVRSYTTESNGDTFKPDTVFESFHY